MSSSNTFSPAPIETNDMKRVRVISSPVNDQERIVPPTPNAYLSTSPKQQPDN
jgi:hypothetical protein